MSERQSLGQPGDGDSVVAEPFACAWRSEQCDVARVCPTGELDIAGQAAFTQTLGEAQQAAHSVMLDLRQLTFMDCAGVRAILQASHHAADAGRRLVLIRGPARVHRLFTLTGTEVALEIVDAT